MISVVIATYNGETVLPKTLAALESLVLPNQGVEFIVVDNNSTDKSQSILTDYVGRLPLTVLFEARQGKSHAIHTGLSQAKGDLIVFADDDVIPDENWLLAYDSEAKEKVDFDVFLGQIRPFWTRKAPKWLQRLADEGRACGCTAANLIEGEASVNWAKGANLCVRKKVLSEVSFRNDLWVAGKESVGGEDTDFVKKAKDKGFALWFVPEACLQHIVRANEMTYLGVWRRYFRIGRSMAAIDNQMSTPTNRIFGYPRWFFAKVFKLCLELMLQILKLNTYKTATSLIKIALLYGQHFQVKQQYLK
jgi:glycosyltransferase involved in cell wall biosynthesis